MNETIPLRGVPVSGWMLLSEATFLTWTRFSVRGDWRDLLAIGTKVKLFNLSTKYFYIIAVSFDGVSTILEVAAGKDYLLARTAIPEVYFSNDIASPGHPVWFNWTPTITGFSTPPTDAVYRFMVQEGRCVVQIRQATSGVSDSDTFTISAPVPAANVENGGWLAVATATLDNDVLSLTPGLVQILEGSSTIECFPTLQGAAGPLWTTSGTKSINVLLSYEI